MTREITPEEVREFAENVFMVGPDYASDLAACFEGLEWFCDRYPEELFVEIQREDKVWLVRLMTVLDIQYRGSSGKIQHAIIQAVNAAARARGKP